MQMSDLFHEPERIAMSTHSDHIRHAAARLADITAQEMALEDNRANVKMQVIERLMAGENKLTGKPHSFSSAEAAAASDPAYTDYLEQLREAARARIMARGMYEAAIVAGRLAEEANV